jgi:hypothetical protein
MRTYNFTVNGVIHTILADNFNAALDKLKQLIK